MIKDNNRQEYVISPAASERLTILKVIFTIMVLFGHSYSNTLSFADEQIVVTGAEWLSRFKVIVSSVIVSISVPGFYFMSAFLLYKKPYSYMDNLRKKIRRIAVPYLIVTTFWIAALYIAQKIPGLNLLFSGSNRVITGWSAKDWIEAYWGSSNSRFPFVYPLWFLRDLFVMNALSKVFDVITDLLGDFSIILFILPWLFAASSPVYFCDIRAVCFWGIGCYFAKRPGSLSFLERINKGVLTVAFIVLTAASYIVSEAGFGGALVVYRISVIVSLMFWYMITSVIGSRSKTFLLSLAKYSFCIYLFHEFSMTTLKKILAKILPASVAFQFIEFILIPVIILFFTIACCMLLERFTPGLYAVLNGLSPRARKSAAAK